MRIVDRGLAIAAALAIAGSLGVAAARGAPSGYTGSYAGVGRAAGMSMRLQQSGDKVTGDVADGRSAPFHLSGRSSAKAVLGSLYNGATAANFEMLQAHAGLELRLTPLTPAGKADTAKTVRYGFARARPAQAGARSKALQPDATADALAFAFNYQRWSASNLVAAYEDLSATDRGLINVFDHIQADVMYRLCRAKAPATAIKTISQNQSLSCGALESRVANARRKRVMRRFDEAVAAQRASLYAALRCRHRAGAAGACEAAAKATSYAAVHWADASRIFGDLSGGSAGPVRVAAAVRSTERGHRARGRARSTRPAPVLPRPKPLLISDGGGTTPAVRVASKALAGADQSQNVHAQPRDNSRGGSFGFELRPTLAERQQFSKSLDAILPGKLVEKLRGDGGRGDEPAVGPAPRTVSGVPLPRPRPRSGG